MDIVRQISRQINKDPKDISAYVDLLSLLSDYDKETRHYWCDWVRKKASKNLALDERMYEIYKAALRTDAKDYFDSYLLYLEINRLPKDRFYQPRRKVLKKAVDAIQRLVDGEIDELFLSQPPRTGKTSLCMFLFSWLVGRDSEVSNLYSAFSEIICSAFYQGVLEIIKDDMTYTWKEVFPDSKLVHTNSKELTLNMDRNKRYPSMTCRSLYGTLNGACDCTGVLLSDDLIGGIEEALNPARLQAAWTKVDNNLLTRGKLNARIMWVGTRWSIADPAGRRIDLLENDPKYSDRKWEVITLPALDEHGESNFDYEYGVGFDTQYYVQRRASFEHNNDLASWLAQYQQQPIEREGSLFESDKMRYYNNIIPDDVEKVFMAVDPAFGGGDFVSAPVCVKTESGIYIPEVVFDDSDKSKTIPKLIDVVMRHNVRLIQFGVNRMTESYKEEFQSQMRDKHPDYKLTVQTKNDPVLKSKQQRIFDMAPNIRDMMVFLASAYRSPEYEKFMQNVFGFTVLGKNRHDDAPDSLAMAMDMELNPWGTYHVFRRPF